MRVAFRILMLLVAVHVAGLASLVVVDCCSADDDDCATQTDQKPCNDCPPDCPKCHCNRVAFSVPRAAEASEIVAPQISRTTAFTPYEATIPREPPLASLFRPPRSPLST